MNTPTFAARIRAARELRGMSAAHLASLTGIAAANISHYEAGQRQPGVDSLRALALMLDISADYLLGLSDSTARINEEGSPLAIDRRSGDTLGVNLTWSAAEARFEMTSDVRWRDLAKHDQEAEMIAMKVGLRALRPGDELPGGMVCADGKFWAELMDVLSLMKHPAFPDSVHHERVKALGREIGFGALMSTAEAGWREAAQERGYPSGGEFIAGPCRASVDRLFAMLAAAKEGKDG